MVVAKLYPHSDLFLQIFCLTDSFLYIYMLGLFILFYLLPQMVFSDSKLRANF